MYKKTNNAIYSEKQANVSIKTAKNLVANREGELVGRSYKSRLDDYENLKSTTQLTGLNFDDFTEHVFFDSAEDKTKFAFENVLKRFPYDESDSEISNYLLQIDGYSKHIFDNKTKKNQGCYNFNNDYYIQILDDKKIVDNKTKTNISIIEKKSTIQFWIKPKITEDSYIVAQKLYQDNTSNEKEGFCITVESLNENLCNLSLIVFYKLDILKCTVSIEKDKFVNVVFKLDNSLGKIKITPFLNNRLTDFLLEGEAFINLHTNNFKSTELLIGAGNQFDQNNYLGAKCSLDDFCLFRGILKSNEIIKNIEQGADSKDNACFIYRFNEVAEDYVNNIFTIDYSGNKLHGVIKAISGDQITLASLSSLRETHENNPIIYEKEYYKHCFSSSIQENKDNFNEIIQIAKDYDIENPNTVWKLLPKYLFVEGSDFSSNESIYYDSKEIDEEPGNHYLVNLLIVWGRFFDNLKCFIDVVTESIDIDYDSIENKRITGSLVKNAAKYLGYNIEEIFGSPTIEKLEGLFLSGESKKSDISIREIQNILWKRLLINSQDILRSKGTIQSIKSLFNSFGLEHDLFVDINEYSSQNKINFNQKFSSKTKNIKILDFSNNIGKEITYNELGLPENSFCLTTDSSIDECNFNFNCCWTIEFYNKFIKSNKSKYKDKQSLLKIKNNETGDLICNVIYEKVKEDHTGNFKITIDPFSNGNVKTLVIENIDLFDDRLWHFTLGCDFISNNKVEIKFTASRACNESEYFQRKKASIIIEKTQDFTNNIEIIFGCKESINKNIQEMDYTTDFEGKLTNIKLWKTSLSDRILDIHAKNPLSIAIEEKLKENILYLNNEKYITNYTSLEDLSDETFFVNNEKKLFNFSYNQLTDNLMFTLFSSDNNINNILAIETFTVLDQSYVIDNQKNYSKVNIVSFEEKNAYYNENRKDEVLEFDSKPLTSYNNKKKIDIDFSSVKLINEDINRILDAYDLYTNYVINSVSKYNFSYSNLEGKRREYFSRLEENINFKNLYQIFRYFDEIMQSSLESLIPQNTNYQGFNYVIESHILERHKYCDLNSKKILGVWETNFSNNYYNAGEHQDFGMTFNNISRTEGVE